MLASLCRPSSQFDVEICSWWAMLRNPFSAKDGVLTSTQKIPQSLAESKKARNVTTERHVTYLDRTRCASCKLISLLPWPPRPEMTRRRGGDPGLCCTTV